MLNMSWHCWGPHSQAMGTPGLARGDPRATQEAGRGPRDAGARPTCAWSCRHACSCLLVTGLERSPRALKVTSSHLSSGPHPRPLAPDQTLLRALPAPPPTLGALRLFPRTFSTTTHTTGSPGVRGKAEDLRRVHPCRPPALIIPSAVFHGSSLARQPGPS